MRFGRMEEVDPTQRGIPFDAGKYEVQIGAVKGAVKQGTGEEFFVVETEITASNNPDVKIGEQRSWVVNVSNPKAFDAPWKDIKAFLCAALAIPLADKQTTGKVGVKVAEYVTGPDQPFKGIKLALHCHVRPPTPEKPKPFTYHNWSPLEPERGVILREHFFDTLHLAKQSEAIAG